jgi:hypothetical protein
MESAWTRSLWNAFVQQMLERNAADPKLSGLIEHSAGFFQALAEKFQSAEEISAQSVAKAFDSRVLRKHLLASRFLADALQIAGLEDEVEAVTEWRRVNDLLARVRGTRWGALLERYAEWMFAREVAVRTARLYLRAAEAFCDAAGASDIAPWAESDAISYLSSSPGHAASLTRFMTFCREWKGWDVRMPPKSLWTRAPSAKTAEEVKRLRKLLKRMSAKETDLLTTREIARVLSLATGVPAARLIRERQAGAVAVDERGSIAVTQDAVISAEQPLYRFARRWAELAARQ